MPRSWFESNYGHLRELGNKILSRDYSYCVMDISEAQLWRTVLTGRLKETKELDEQQKEEIRKGIGTIEQAIDNYVDRFHQSLNLLRELKREI